MTTAKKKFHTTNKKQRRASPEKIDMVARNRQIMEMRIASMPFWKIAAAVNMSESGVEAVVVAELKKMQVDTTEKAETVRAQMLEQIERMMEALYPYTLPRKKVIQELVEEKGKPSRFEPKEIEVPPAPEYVDRMVKLQHRKAMLLGLDTTTVKQIGDPDKPVHSVSEVKLDKAFMLELKNALLDSV